MGFRINTNIAAMNAHTNAINNNREIDSSLARLSSGLRINTAADDASGLVIADSLKSQSNSLGQAIKNANDAIGMVKIADKAMDVQIKILDTIKTKATQAAADGQSLASRQAIQNDISKLLEELDNIANTTSYNGINLLSGNFTNKEFQIGAYSRETINLSIGDTTSAKIGSTRFETTKSISSAADLSTSSNAIHIIKNGVTTTIAGVKISNTAGTGLGALAESINRASDVTGVRAKAMVQSTGTAAVAAGSTTNLVINSITIGAVKDIKANDSDGKLTNAINAVTTQTGVVASVDAQGRMNLTSVDGRGIVVSAGGVATQTATLTTAVTGLDYQYISTSTLTMGDTLSSSFKIIINGTTYTPPTLNDRTYNGVGANLDLWVAGVANSAFGAAVGLGSANNLNFFIGSSDDTANGASIQVIGTADDLTKLGITNGSGITGSATVSAPSGSTGSVGSTLMSITSAAATNFGRLSLISTGSADILISSAAVGGSIFANSYESTINLRSISNLTISNSALAIGAYANKAQSAGATVSIGMGVGVTTRAGAMMVMDIAESAMRQLDTIRAGLGSAQNQLAFTVENISVAKVNVSAAESQIRDVDFAEESANFSKRNILAQAGSYATVT